MLRDLWRAVPFVGAVCFVGGALATIGLLVRAEWTRGADGRRRPQGPGRLWLDPARIPVAGRRYERLARRTALVAGLGLVLIWLAAITG